MSDPSTVTVAPIAWYRRGPRWSRRALVLSIGTGFLAQTLLVVSGVVVARTLGVTDRGHFAVLTVLATAVAFVGMFGVPDALSYYIARERHAARTLARRLVTLALGQAAVLVIVQAAILTAVVVDETAAIKRAALITLLWLPGVVAWQYGLAILQAERRFGAVNVIRMLPIASYSALAVAVAAAGPSSVPMFAAAWTVSCAVSGVLSVRLARRAVRGAEEPSAVTVTQVASFGARGAIGQVSLTESFRVDQLVAGFFLGPAPLGLYSVAAAFTNLTMILAISIGVVEYPHVAGQPDRAAARRTVLRYVVLTLALCGMIVLGLELILPVLIPFLFGDDFAGAVPVARILVLAGVALAVRRILSDGLRALGRPTAGTIAELASWAALVPLLAVLAPLFGITGIAAAVTLSACVGAVSLGVVLWRFRESDEDPTAGGRPNPGSSAEIHGREAISQTEQAGPGI